MTALGRSSSNCKHFEDYNCKCSVGKKILIVILKGLGAKTN
jgi:hypothetical protein